MTDGAFPGPLKELLLAQEPKKDKRVHSGLNAIPPVLTITDVHRLVVMAQVFGFTHEEIGLMANLSPSWVAQVCGWKHPLLDQARSKAREQLEGNIHDLGQRIKFHADEALRVHVDIMRDGSDRSNQRLAAREILHMAGYAPVKKSMEVRTEVPSEEFIQAVAKMEKANEVQQRQEDWAFRLPPVAVVDPPNEETPK